MVISDLPDAKREEAAQPLVLKTVAAKRPAT